MAKHNKRQNKQKNQYNMQDSLNYALLACIILITVLTYPMNNKIDDVVTIHHVWYYGWMTAVATGLGAIPFIFFSQPDKFWMGISNGKLFNSIIIRYFTNVVVLFSCSWWDDDCRNI